MANETVNTTPISDRLVTDWQANLEQTNQQGSGSFQPYEWLSTFYDQVYLKSVHSEPVFQSAQEVLNSLNDKKRTKEINQLVAGLSPNGRYSRSGLRGIIPELKFKHRFEQLLKSGEEGQVDTFDEVRAQSAQGEQLALSHLSELTKKEGELPAVQRGMLEQITTIKLTEVDLIDQMVEADCAREGSSAGILSQAIKKIRADTLEARSGFKLAAVIAENKALLSNLSDNEELKQIVNNPQNLVRIRQLAADVRGKAAIANIQEALSDGSVRQLLFTELIHSGQITKDTAEYLPGMAAITSCLARKIQLDSAGITFDSPEQRKIFEASMLIDLIEEGISATLIEDIVNQKVTVEDLLVQSALDWLSQNGESDEIQKSGLNLKHLDSVKEALLKAGSVALVPLQVLIALRSLVPGSLPLPIPGLGMGGGADLEFRSPFEGALFESHQQVWQLSGWDPQENNKLRLHSSSTFNLETASWEDDNDSLLYSGERDPFILDSGYDTGEIRGTHPKKKSGFCYYPVPYGSTIGSLQLGHTGTALDKRTDGSFGIDLDYPMEENGSGYRRLNVALYEKQGSKATVRFTKARYDAEEQMFPHDTEKTTKQLIPSVEALPEDVQIFLQSLDQSKLSQEEEATKISEFVHETFTYSLDPANKAVYEEARKKGAVDFFNCLYEFKKVKCDGAATAAIALMRLRKIPARMASGFEVEDPESITANQAHAWVECWPDGKFKILDPTPENTDEITKKIQGRSDLLARILSKLTLSEFFGPNTYEMQREVGTVINRLFKKTGPNMTPYDSISYHGSKSDLPKKAAKADAKKTRESIRQVERDLNRRGNFNSEDVVTAIVEAQVLSERELRQQMLDRNLYQMLRPLSAHFYKQLFPEGLIDTGFIQKWDLPESFGSVWENPGSQLYTDLTSEEAKQDFVRLHKLRTGQGDSIPVFLIAMKSALQHRIYTAYINSYHNVPKSRQAEWHQELEEQRKKYSEKITTEAVQESGLVELVTSYAQALSMLPETT